MEFPDRVFKALPCYNAVAVCGRFSFLAARLRARSLPLS